MLKEEIYLLLNDIDTLKVQLHDQEIMNSRAKKEINTMINSNSWKVTKPLRSISHKIKK